MGYVLLHLAVILALLVKALSNIMGLYSANPLWFHISGISAGASVILGILWAAVFLHGNNFTRISKPVKIALPLAAILAVASMIIST